MNYEHEYLAQYVENFLGLISYNEVKYLIDCVWLVPENTQVVELGPYQGKSTAAICATASRRGLEVITIDNFQWAFRYGASSAKSVYDNLEPFGAKLTVVVSDSRKVPQKIDKVGFLFADTTHTAEHLNAEFDVWLPHIVAGGVVMVHDYHPDFPGVVSVVEHRLRNSEDWNFLGQKQTLIAFQKRI